MLIWFLKHCLNSKIPYTPFFFFPTLLTLHSNALVVKLLAKKPNTVCVFPSQQSVLNWKAGIDSIEHFFFCLITILIGVWTQVCSWMATLEWLRRSLWRNAGVLFCQRGCNLLLLMKTQPRFVFTPAQKPFCRLCISWAEEQHADTHLVSENKPSTAYFWVISLLFWVLPRQVASPGD